MTDARREGTLLLAIGCVPFAVGAVVSRDGITLMPPCPFRTLTGLAVPAVRRDARVRLGRAR